METNLSHKAIQQNMDSENMNFKRSYRDFSFIVDEALLQNA